MIQLLPPACVFVVTCVSCLSAWASLAGAESSVTAAVGFGCGRQVECVLSCDSNYTRRP